MGIWVDRLSATVRHKPSCCTSIYLRSSMDFPVVPDASSMSMSSSAESPAQRHVLVCQNRTCLRQGAAAVLAAFQAQPTSGCAITKTGCMGQCGNGPMVRILPDDVWYCRVLPQEVGDVVKRHLQGGRPVKAMLSPHFHADLRRHL